MTNNTEQNQAVVVLAGARDKYQLPLALDEGNLLRSLVTDVYFPARQGLSARLLKTVLSEKALLKRSCTGLDDRKVTVSKRALLVYLAMKLQPHLKLNRLKDRMLSAKAGQLAIDTNTALFCYSYYASEAFKSAGKQLQYRFLFQVHPHPYTTRKYLLEESELVPQAQKSLRMEHEIALPADEFDDLASEPHLANGLVVASSFTAQTLMQHGIPEVNIHIVPYGVDHKAFPLRTTSPSPNRPFTIIFLGSMIQRKGISYLLDAARALKHSKVKVVLCGRGLIDRTLLSHYSDLNLEVKVGLSHEQLVLKLWNSDVFIFPSLVEGFGHAILEAMSCGLPVITTTNTCGPDVLVEGEHGFVVPVRDSWALIEKIEWGLMHRTKLSEMGQEAAQRARTYTWEQFRVGIRTAYKKMLRDAQAENLQKRIAHASTYKV